METVKTEAQFKKWAEKRNITLINESDGFKVNDTVTFTNDYGIKFEGLQIIGIDTDKSFYGRNIYLNSDAYWFPHKSTELELN